MTKALASYPKNERHEIALRRVKGNTGGLGMLAAQDFLKVKAPEADAAPAEKQDKQIPESIGTDGSIAV